MLRSAERFVARILSSSTDARSLGLFRLLYCASIALSVGWRLDSATLEVLRRQPEAFRPIRLFAAIGLRAFPAEAFVALHHVLLAALLLAAVGLLARPALWLSWVSYVFFLGATHSAIRPDYIDVIGHQTEPVFFVLFILACAPEIGRWGLDGWLARRRGDGDGPAGVPAWPLHAVVLFIALVYFGAAYDKLHASLRWPDGVALQTILLEKYMQTGVPLALATAQSRVLCAVLSWACLLFELTVGAALIWPGLGPVYACAGLAMHAGMWLTMDLNYFRYFAPMYFVFLARRPAQGPESVTASFTRWRGREAVVAAVTAVNLIAIFAQVRFWPVWQWGFYGYRGSYEETAVYRLQAIGEDGGARWLSAPELHTGPVVVSNSIGGAVVRKDPRWIERRLRVLFADDRFKAPVILVVQRRVGRKPDGRFEVVDTPIYRMTRSSQVLEALQPRVALPPLAAQKGY